MTYPSALDLREPFERVRRHQADLRSEGTDVGREGERPSYPEPEDRGDATLSARGDVEYVSDLIRPGRIVVVSGEEGTGKSYLVDAELGIRVAAAGGAVAGTWDVVRTGGVLVLSEMHPDDDFLREAAVLGSLGMERAALRGRYHRLSLLTAAGDRPALMDAGWRDWVAGWVRDHGVILLIVDTATGATQVRPWGEEIQQVYRDLRLMLDAAPDLAVVLLLHMKKPTGRGARRISDVLGEWGRWCDVVVLMENERGSLERVRVTVRKRVRRELTIVATKRDGLLVDPARPEAAKGPRVPQETVLDAIVARPGITYAELGAAIGVSKDTAKRYAEALGDQVGTIPGTNRAPARVYASAAAPHGAAQARAAMPAEPDAAQHRSAARTSIGAAGRAAALADGRADPAADWDSWDEDLAEHATDDDAEDQAMWAPADPVRPPLLGPDGGTP